MNATETEFFRAFAGRVRDQLPTARRGDPTMSATDIAETTNTAVPVTFQAAPDAPCEAYPWCVEKGAHVDHFGRRVALPSSDRGMVLEAHLYTDQPSGVPVIDYDRGIDDWREFTSGDELRAEVAQVRAHLVRLEALADEYDAVREAAGAETPSTSVRDEKPRQWTLRSDTGVTVFGYLPPWAEEDPSDDNIPVKKLRFRLSDITHERVYDAPQMTVRGPFGDDGALEDVDSRVFAPQIWCGPHSDYPEERQPYAFITVLEECVIDHLGPQEVADIAGKLRAQADVLDQAAIDLAAARADWDANGGAL
ncbi:DUF6907 domain-containing protein [Actinacidiphila acidipaludis]|uniref:Uncharacterized protein n=1 Tax=Actinacidiphila acidipaludis TaxID=2873382 RepID=A0ABS7Q994_9ACTN|nr:hypothetical protein [Streptomyces acidipaludis]MBY8879729.1 hypothetical protein [Streptomyces acidipaludis]